MPTELLPVICPTRLAWNKGRIIGQKRPLLPKHVWSIRVRLEMADDLRDLALFAHSGASDHAFRRHPIADSGVSDHPGCRR
jgi:hypothetical protein